MSSFFYIFIGMLIETIVLLVWKYSYTKNPKKWLDGGKSRSYQKQEMSFVLLLVDEYPMLALMQAVFVVGLWPLFLMLAGSLLPCVLLFNFVSKRIEAKVKK